MYIYIYIAPKLLYLRYVYVLIFIKLLYLTAIRDENRAI